MRPLIPGEKRYGGACSTKGLRVPEAMTQAKQIESEFLNKYAINQTEERILTAQECPERCWVGNEWEWSDENIEVICLGDTRPKFQTLQISLLFWYKRRSSC